MILIMTVTTTPSTFDPTSTGDMIDTVSAAPDTENVKVINLIVLSYNNRDFYIYI